MPFNTARIIGIEVDAGDTADFDAAEAHIAADPDPGNRFAEKDAILRQVRIEVNPRDPDDEQENPGDKC